MSRIDNTHVATLELSLSWRDETARHEERYLARKVNPWRDIFPPGLRERLEGLAVGETASCAYAPGHAIPARRDDMVKRLPRSSFTSKTVAGRHIEPRLGRFYPRGLFAGLCGVFPQDLRPARIVAMDADSLTLDLNHPLAGRPFTLAATVRHLAPKASDTGGHLFCWLEEMADYGPGMQSPLPGMPTDFLSGDALSRPDASPDADFYAQPRLFGHIDAQADALLTGVYATHLRPGMAVLDLMSSVASHLPLEADIALPGLHVTGLGLNAREMAANPRLAERVLHDVNGDPVLPFPDAAFDAVFLSLSVEYLARPREVMAQCARVLRPGGRLCVGFSDRWFPQKVTTVWPDLHPFERLGLVAALVLDTGSFADLAATSLRNWWRPTDDPHIRQTITSDPVFVVTGERGGA
ncbi:methyltransferase domain-containing protein [Desulfolutivibrio sp.]|uniref:methyltransferase domain-containing protein n=1 Tax=Desulfolutivibrio sp. TaxID=2773296 RepID=UPI002F961F32